MTIRKTITLTGKQDKWIKAQITSGDYTNNSEYFRDLIRRDQEQNAKFRALKQAIQEGTGEQRQRQNRSADHEGSRIPAQSRWPLIEFLRKPPPILNFGLTQAQAYLHGLHERFDALANNPAMGRLAPHLARMISILSFTFPKNRAAC